MFYISIGSKWNMVKLAVKLLPKWELDFLDNQWRYVRNPESQLETLWMIGAGNFSESVATFRSEMEATPSKSSLDI